MIMSLIVGYRGTLMSAHPQIPLCCPCGSFRLFYRGWCRACYGRRSRSRARFGRLARENPGPRPPSLPRLRGPRMACGPSSPPAAHLRFPDHPLRRLPRAAAPLGAIHRWVPEPLLELWAEQHPGAPRQLQTPRFAVVMSTPLPPATLPPSATSPAPLVGPGAQRASERALPPRLPPGAGGVF